MNIATDADIEIEARRNELQRAQIYSTSFLDDEHEDIDFSDALKGTGGRFVTSNDNTKKAVTAEQGMPGSAKTSTLLHFNELHGWSAVVEESRAPKRRSESIDYTRKKGATDIGRNRPRLKSV